MWTKQRVISAFSRLLWTKQNFKGLLGSVGGTWEGENDFQPKLWPEVKISFNIFSTFSYSWNTKQVKNHFYSKISTFLLSTFLNQADPWFFFFIK